MLIHITKHPTRYQYVITHVARPECDARCLSCRYEADHSCWHVWEEDVRAIVGAEVRLPDDGETVCLEIISTEVK